MSVSREIRAWVANQLGPDIGNIHVVTADRSDAYMKRITGGGVTHGSIYTSLAAAEDAATTGQNDVLLVYPGNHITTAEIDWDKANVNMIGVLPNPMGDYSQGGCSIYTETAAVGHTIHLSGANCRFQNLKIANVGAATTNLSAVQVDGEGTVFKNCNLMGIWHATQATSANPYSVGIGLGGYYPLFEDCVIGHNTGTIRTQTLSGHLKFTGAGAGTYPPDGGVFRRVRFVSYSETAGVAVVYLPTTQCIDRDWLFEDCIFTNFYVNAATLLTEAIDDNSAYTHKLILKNCTAQGYAQWQTNDTAIQTVVADMPIVGLGGGLATIPTAATGS